MKIISILKYTFAAIGIGLLIGAFFAYQNTRGFLIGAATTEGKVVELERSRSGDSHVYRPVVEFNTPGESVVRFTSPVGSNPASYSVGEKVEVMYLESSPEKARINGFFSLWGLPVILGVLGSVFFLVGFSIFMFGRLTGRKVAYLKEHGVPIKAQFKGVEKNSMISVNGKNPYQIHAHWKNPYTSDLHIFKSENIWIDPTDYVTSNEVTVLIEKDNPKKYHVDISFIPKVIS
jgi:hypothetical protein